MYQCVYVVVGIAILYAGIEYILWMLISWDFECFVKILDSLQHH